LGTAHVTQFTRIGWEYLANGTGSGELPSGGYYTTWVDPSSTDFTMNIVKISRDHASCTRPALPSFDVQPELAAFHLHESMGSPEQLEVWYSNFEAYEGPPPLFEHSQVKVHNGTFVLNVPVGAMFTVTTLKVGHKGSFGIPPAASPLFPLPHVDTFQLTEDSHDAPMLSDQIGAFEVHDSDDDQKSLVQMVPDLPIGWADHGSNGPMTLLGMREWQDVVVSIAFRLPDRNQSAPPGDAADAACVATRVDQMWQNGVVLCINADGQWNLTNAGPPLQGLGLTPPVVVASGQASVPVGRKTWHSLSLEVQRPRDLRGEEDLATGALDGKVLFVNSQVRGLDTGFAAFGANGFWPIQFRNLSVARAQRGWETWGGCSKPMIGAVLSAQACSRNGLWNDDQAWNLLPSFQLQHALTGLCASANAGGTVALQICNSTDPSQLFVNDYTAIRNWPVVIKVASEGKTLVGTRGGTISVGSSGDWSMWSYFPNTQQLRNQYSASSPKGHQLGYPLCLSTCPHGERNTILV